MATLIPAIGSCLSRMTSGEKRFAYRLEDKLESDYLCWYDVSIGERTLHPDFVVFHPCRGLLVLEVKDWKFASRLSRTCLQSRDTSQLKSRMYCMAVLYRRYGIGQQLADTLKRKGIPVQWKQDKKLAYSPLHDSVKLITMHSSKGLEFPLVYIPAIGAPSKEEEDLQDEARLLYVAMTRATQQLVMTHGETSSLAEKMQKAMGVLQPF